MQPEFIFDDICNTLTNPPPECSKYVEETHVEASVTNAWEIILLVVVVGFLVFSLIVTLSLCSSVFTVVT